MTFKIVDYRTVAKGFEAHGGGKVQTLLDAFIASEAKCAEVDVSHYADVWSARRSIAHTIKKYSVPHIIVMVRKGKLYLVNDLINEKIE